MATRVKSSVSRLRMRPGAAVTAAALGICVAISGCSSDSAGKGGQGVSVELGASKAEYQEALADMEPVELEVQTLAAFDAANGRPFVAYWDAVEDWSGGKITFNRTPNSGISPLPEAFESLNDGRLDMTVVLPSYSPQEFPVNTAISEISGLGPGDPIVSELVQYAMTTELVLDVAPEAMDEAEQAGTHLLVPSYAGGMATWACSSERRSMRDFDGALLRVGDTGAVPRVEAVGAEASFIPVAEVFEGLQRGVVDCAHATMNTHDSFGYLPEAPHLVIDEDVSLGSGLSAVGVSQAVWDDLPLAAQQLLFDRLDVWYEENLYALWESTAAGLQTATDNGGTIGGFDEDAAQAITEANGNITESMRQDERFSDADEVVTSAIESAEEWEAKVADLGYTYDVEFDEFSAWFSRDKVDLQPYLDALFEDVLTPHRPE
jgi:TRAP-type C4-dicarboxylate transport system substrate-binding protein